MKRFFRGNTQKIEEFNASGSELILDGDFNEALYCKLDKFEVKFNTKQNSRDYLKRTIFNQDLSDIFCS